ncbi:MAG: rhodanese-like domain-containing protein [Alphaproteobacteria bacterium]
MALFQGSEAVSGDRSTELERIEAAEAFERVRHGVCALVDVRTAEERKSLGYVPQSVHIAWRLGPALTRNPRFLRELAQRVRTGEPVIFICRSEARSAEAAHAAAEAGYQVAYVAGGAENGWRAQGLPWSFT